MSSKFGTAAPWRFSDRGNYVLDLSHHISTPPSRSLSTYIIGTDSQGNVLAELALEGLVVLLLQHTHVVGHVQSEDVLTVHIGVQLLLLRAIKIVENFQVKTKFHSAFVVF